MKARTLPRQQHIDERSIGREDLLTIPALLAEALVDAAGARLEALGDATWNGRLFRTGTGCSLTAGDPGIADREPRGLGDSGTDRPTHLERTQTWARLETTRRAA